MILQSKGINNEDEPDVADLFGDFTGDYPENLEAQTLQKLTELESGVPSTVVCPVAACIR